MSQTYQCPGSSTRNLTADIIVCPGCGEQVEIFSDESKRRCPSCRQIVHRERLPSCVDWCPSARECIGNAWWQAFQADKEKD